jgi:hypothetical protein
MVTLDKIRLTGLLTRSPASRGFSMSDGPATRRPCRRRFGESSKSLDSALRLRRASQPDLAILQTSSEASRIVRYGRAAVWESVARRFKRRRRKIDRPRGIPEHASPVRWIVADTFGGSYEAFRSLDDARSAPDSVVVMEGDYGGSIYLTCPARLVQCDEATLRDLLRQLDEEWWNDLEGAGLYYERAPVGSAWLEERVAQPWWKESGSIHPWMRCRVARR